MKSIRVEAVRIDMVVNIAGMSSISETHPPIREPSTEENHQAL